jgi:hypothetical protein
MAPDDYKTWMHCGLTTSQNHACRAPLLIAAMWLILSACALYGQSAVPDSPKPSRPPFAVRLTESAIRDD